MLKVAADPGGGRCSLRGIINMSICDDIMVLLKDMSERLAKLEEKVSTLSITLTTVNAAINGEIEMVQLNTPGKVDVNGETKESNVF